MFKMKLISSGVLIFLLFLACNYPTSKDNTSDINRWVQHNANEIKTLDPLSDQDDLGVLSDIVGEASLVCLGESRHDIREQFLIKDRMVRHLVEELGFTTFIIEGSMPYSKRIDAFILNGEGNIEEIMSAMPGWFLWDTREILDMFLWMREYNLNQENENKIRFFGIDIVAPNDALDQIFSFLESYDTQAYESFIQKEFARDLIRDEMWPRTREAYLVLSDDEQRLLNQNYQELYDHLIRNEEIYIGFTSQQDYAWIRQMAFCALEANTMFSADTRLSLGLSRDQAMAKNTMWIKEHMLDEKLIIWAHNVHIAADEFTMTLEDGIIQGMGNLLKKELGDKMISIGAAFNKGEYPNWNRSFMAADSNTIDEILSRSGMEYALFDLIKGIESEAINKWLNEEQVLRAQDFEMSCVPIKSFDGFYFVENISRAIPNQSSAERFRGNN